VLFLSEAVSLAIPAAPVDPDASPEAVDWFRARVPVRPEVWRSLSARARRRAFTVANAESLDVLAHVWRAIDRAIAQGEDFIDFKRAVGDSLRQTWANTPGRMEVVFRNNVQVAYASGRYVQATDPDVLSERPYWRYETILDTRTSAICAPLDGVTLLATDAWWQSHYPPLHHQCRSGVATLTEEQARGEKRVAPPSPAPQPGWGMTPEVHEWSPNAAEYPPELWTEYERWQTQNSS
jgi:uncharacterized protein with gpF-like domain